MTWFQHLISYFPVWFFQMIHLIAYDSYTWFIVARDHDLFIFMLVINWFDFCIWFIFQMGFFTHTQARKWGGLSSSTTLWTFVQFRGPFCYPPFSNFDCFHLQPKLMKNPSPEQPASRATLYTILHFYDIYYIQTLNSWCQAWAALQLPNTALWLPSCHENDWIELSVCVCVCDECLPSTGCIHFLE